MSDWLKPEYLLSGLALLISWGSVWFSRSSAHQSKRSADAAEESKETAKESVSIQRSQWIESRSALISIEDIRKYSAIASVNGMPVVPGFMVDFHNLGKAIAVDIKMVLTIDGVAQDEDPTVPDMKPGDTRRVRFRFTDRLYLPSQRFIITVQYQHTELHDMVFVLEKPPGELAVPSLIAASLDKRHHPGHLAIARG